MVFEFGRHTLYLLLLFRTEVYNSADTLYHFFAEELKFLCGVMYIVISEAFIFEKKLFYDLITLLKFKVNCF